MILRLQKEKLQCIYSYKITPDASNAGSLSGLVIFAISSFDLPESMDEFRKETKLVNSKRDPRFRKLFKELIKAELEEIMLLVTWISYLKKENYNADMEALKGM